MTEYPHHPFPVRGCLKPKMNSNSLHIGDYSNISRAENVIYKKQYKLLLKINIMENASFIAFPDDCR